MVLPGEEILGPERFDWAFRFLLAAYLSSTGTKSK